MAGCYEQDQCLSCIHSAAMVVVRDFNKQSILAAVGFVGCSVSFLAWTIIPENSIGPTWLVALPFLIAFGVWTITSVFALIDKGANRRELLKKKGLAEAADGWVQEESNGAMFEYRVNAYREIIAGNAVPEAVAQSPEFIEAPPAVATDVGKEPFDDRTFDVPPELHIRFDCPACGKSIKAPASRANTTAKCPNCSAKIAVPDRSDD